MKHFCHLLIFLASVSVLTACNDYETYADQKEKERDGISDFIAYRNIKVISEETFHAQGDSTGASEYVYMNNSGVYMQIVNKGSGTGVQSSVKGENLYIRFIEQSIFDTTSVVTNYNDSYDPDIMNSRYSGQVPAGWLVPLSYIKVGAPTADKDISLVRLIVPHTQGHTVASSNVYPYFYEISFQRHPGL